LDLREKEWEIVGWIHLVEDRYQWRALVKKVMKIRVQKTWGIS
jgi:hypothetical protein